jgi:hypothetical protein
MRSSGFRILAAAIAVLASAAMAPTADAQTRFQDGKPVIEEKTPFGYLPADVRAKMRAQEPLTKAASVLRWEFENAPARNAGYANIVLEKNAVALHWKGEVSAGMKAAVTRAGRHAAVRVVPARYSQAELRAATAPIFEYMKKHPGGPVRSVGVTDGGDALEVGVVDSDPRVAGADLPEVNIPVKVVPKQAPKSTSRLADTPPYWGGARIQTPDSVNPNAYCSTGFGVKNGAGIEYVLTAAHCYTPPDRATVWATGTTMGYASHEVYWHDILLITTHAGGRIYDGGVGTGEFSKSVYGWDWAYAGEYLCQSGATSGVVCNFTQGNGFTYSYCDYDSDGDWTCQDDLLLAVQMDGLQATRGGDSGGPVFGLRNDGVVAKGIVSGHAGFSYMIHQDFGTAWRDFGVTPIFG